MKIILEGVDGMGKTTLAQHLCRKFGLGYYHPPKPQLKDFKNFHIYSFAEYKAALKLNHVILDRSFISEYAYNYNHDLSYLMHFREHNYLLFVIVFEGNINDLDFWKNKVIEDRLEGGKAERFSKVNQRYINAYEFLKLENKYLFYFNGDYNFIAEQIEKIIETYLSACKSTAEEWNSLNKKS